jgi:hypothetical protein
LSPVNYRKKSVNYNIRPRKQIPSYTQAYLMPDEKSPPFESQDSLAIERLKREKN